MTSQPLQNTKASKDCNQRNRAQLKHVLLDVDFFNNPKIIACEDLFGPFSTLALIAVYMGMSRATNAVISHAAFRAISKRKGIENIQEFEKYCIEEGLILNEMGGYSNSIVIKDQEQYWKKLKKKPKEEENFPEIPGKVPQAEEKTGIPVYDSDIDTELKKNGVPENGLIKISEHVRLTEMSRDQFKMQLKAEGFELKDRKAVIDKLDRWLHKNPEKRKEEDHFRDLMDWPLTEVRKDKLELERARGSPNGKPKEAPRPNRNTANF